MAGIMVHSDYQRCLDRIRASITVLEHPILGGFTIDQWVRFHWIHTRHHDHQIRARRKVLEQSGTTK